MSNVVPFRGSSRESTGPSPKSRNPCTHAVNTVVVKVHQLALIWMWANYKKSFELKTLSSELLTSCLQNGHNSAYLPTEMYRMVDMAEAVKIATRPN